MGTPDPEPLEDRARRSRPPRWPRLVTALLVLTAVGSVAVPLLLERHRQQAPHLLAACLQEYFDQHGRYPDTWQEAARGSFLGGYLRELVQDPDPRRALYYTVWTDRQRCEFVLIDITLRFWQAHRTRHAYWQSATPDTVFEQHWRS